MNYGFGLVFKIIFEDRLWYVANYSIIYSIYWFIPLLFVNIRASVLTSKVFTTRHAPTAALRVVEGLSGLFWFRLTQKTVHSHSVSLCVADKSRARRLWKTHQPPGGDHPKEKGSNRRRPASDKRADTGRMSPQPSVALQGASPSLSNVFLAAASPATGILSACLFCLLLTLILTFEIVF